MKLSGVTFREIGLIAATRALLGVGIGLLLADKVPNQRRPAIGLALLVTGALSTVPLVMDLRRKCAQDVSGMAANI